MLPVLQWNAHSAFMNDTKKFPVQCIYLKTSWILSTLEQDANNTRKEDSVRLGEGICEQEASLNSMKVVQTFPDKPCSVESFKSLVRGRPLVHRTTILYVP